MANKIICTIYIEEGITLNLLVGGRKQLGNLYLEVLNSLHTIYCKYCANFKVIHSIKRLK